MVGPFQCSVGKEFVLKVTKMCASVPSSHSFDLPAHKSVVCCFVVCLFEVFKQVVQNGVEIYESQRVLLLQQQQTEASVLFLSWWVFCLEKGVCVAIHKISGLEGAPLSSSL